MIDLEEDLKADNRDNQGFVDFFKNLWKRSWCRCGLSQRKNPVET
jgi:hypothetical protein